jgi:hypothetical protein
MGRVTGSNGCRRYLARLYGGTEAKLIAASDKTGYGAIAVAARKGGRSLVGVVLAKRSQAEAGSSAIDHCIGAGGVNSKSDGNGSESSQGT